MEFDVDGEVIRVELRIVQTIPHRTVFLDVHGQLGDAAIDVEVPVHVAAGVGLKVDGWVSRFALGFLQLTAL